MVPSHEHVISYFHFNTLIFVTNTLFMDEMTIQKYGWDCCKLGLGSFRYEDLGQFQIRVTANSMVSSELVLWLIQN